MNLELLLYGSGGHAKVLIDILRKQNVQIAGIFDDNYASDTFCSIKSIGKYDQHLLNNFPLIICIGNNQKRKEISKRVSHNLTNIIATSAVVSEDVIMSSGTVILQNAVIQSSSTLGACVILNANSCIDHDCKIMDFVHIGPGAIISNNTTIGEGALISAGAIITKNTVIEPWTVVPPGMVI